MSDFEITITTEPDRRIKEDEEKRLTGLSRTQRWRLACEGRYPPKGEFGPLLSDVAAFVNDPENYRYNGDQVVTGAESKNSVKVRQVKRRVVFSRQRANDEASV